MRPRRAAGPFDFVSRAGCRRYEKKRAALRPPFSLVLQLHSSSTPQRQHRVQWCEPPPAECPVEELWTDGALIAVLRGALTPRPRLELVENCGAGRTSANPFFAT